MVLTKEWHEVLNSKSDPPEADETNPNYSNAY